MKKTCAIIAGLLVIATALAGLHDDTSALDYPMPDIHDELHGSVQSNIRVATNINEFITNIATNLVKQRIRINLNNCIWDPDSKILYERTIKDNRLFYIAVTNVDLISEGLPLVREK